MQHKFTPTTHLKRAALTLLALIMTCASAWAETVTYFFSYENYISYIVYNGTRYKLSDDPYWTTGTATCGDVVVTINSANGHSMSIIQGTSGGVSDGTPYSFSFSSSSKYISHVKIYTTHNDYEADNDTRSHTTPGLFLYSGYGHYNDGGYGSFYQVDLTLSDTQPIHTYNITYELNGGTNAPGNPTTYSNTTSATLADATKTGYTFDGWYDNAQFNGTAITEIPAGLTGNKTVYAKWTANTYAVAFNNNGGSGTMSNQSFTYDEAPKPLTSNTFTRTGYTYSGWNTAANGSGTAYTDGQSVQNLTATNGATVTLFAQWSPITYTVSFNNNGGTGTMTPQAHTYGSSLALTSNTFTRTGYSFAGWATSANGNVVYTNGQTVSNLASTQGANVELFAKWTPITYTVSFNANGGTGTMSNQSFTYNASQALTSNTFTRTGYTFAGWATTANGNVVYTNGQTVSNLASTQGANVELFAKWNPITYTVSFDANGGTGTMAAQTHTYDVSQALTANTFTLTGYSFDGWATTAGGNVVYTDGQTVSNLASTQNANVTLFAKWSPVLSYFWGEGNDGSYAHPYIITTTAGLDLLATLVSDGNDFSGKYFRLGANIEYESEVVNNFTPIGRVINRDVRWFNGNFNGQGSDGTQYEISGINIYKPDDSNLGLFGMTQEDARLDNIVLRNATITGHSFAGGIVGYCVKYVKDCRVFNTSVTTMQSLYGPGIICGYACMKYEINGNYYYNCSAKKGDNAVQTANIGTGDYPETHDIDGAKSIHKLSLDNYVNTSTSPTLTYDNTDYYAVGTPITLSYSGTVSEGQILFYTVNGEVIDGNEFNMPSDRADATAAAVLEIDFAYYWGEGNDGSEAHPYVISTPSGLNVLATMTKNGEHYSGKFFRLGADIDMSGISFNGIGAGAGNSFSGIFDGGIYDGEGTLTGRHTISGINISRNETAGFFLTLGHYVYDSQTYIGGTVRNLVLEGTVSGGSSSSVGRIGGLAGYVNQNSTVENCVSLLLVDPDSQADEKGSLVGKNEGTVSGCHYLGMGGTWGNVALEAVGNGNDAINCTPLYSVEAESGDDYPVTMSSMTSDGTIYGDRYHVAGTHVTMTLTAPEREGYALAGFKYQVYNENTYSYDDVNLTDNNDGTYTLTVPAMNVTIEANYSYNGLAGLTQDDQNRYLITSMDDLRAVASAVDVLEGCSCMTFLLANDIENAGAFSGIAVGTSNGFYGTFDGGGHTISGMTIESDAYSVGFIGDLRGTLQNLTLRNCTVTATDGEAGMLAGSCDNGYMYHCRVLGGTVTAPNASAIANTFYPTESSDNRYDVGVVVVSDGVIRNPGECGTSYGDLGYSNATVLPVEYLDANGDTVVCTEEITRLEGGGATTLAGGWYVVAYNISYTGSVKFSGDAHIILCDGATMTVSGGDINGCVPDNNYGGPIPTYDLNIYGQSTGNNRGSLTVNGAGQAIYCNGLTINGGKVTANSSHFSSTAIIANAVTINGGQVIANGGRIASGIEANANGITLGWQNMNDYIFATSYSGSITIASGKLFIDEDGNIYTSGALTSEELAAIAGKKLYPYVEGSIPYIDENGQRQLRLAGEYITLTGNETTLGTAGEETWYVANSIYEYSHKLSLIGDVHLILCDGADVYLPREYDDEVNYHVSIKGDDDLTIYGQTNGTGTLRSNMIFTDGAITINGGQVTVYAYGLTNSEFSEASILTRESFTLNGGTIYIPVGNKCVDVIPFGTVNPDVSYNCTINGGTVNVSGDNYGIHAYGNVTINGGQVTAWGGESGIAAKNLILGWTQATDYIYANSYSVFNNKTIVAGKAFTDNDGNIYCGTLNYAQLNAMFGKTLHPLVNAVTRTIEGYEEGNGGWVFISSPVTGSIAPNTVANIFSATDYDLYRFNQSADNGKEWQNFKATSEQNHPDFTTLVNGQGYLYATKETKTLAFIGDFNTNNEETVDLVYNNTAEYAGWNLVGNPFPVSATINKPFYVINGRNLEANTGSTVIEPCTGVMVQAASIDLENNTINYDDIDESVTFTRATASSSAPQPNQLQMTVAQQVVNRDGVSSTIVDNAIVSFNEGNLLEKFVFNADLAKLYIPQNGKDYAIVSVSAGTDVARNVSTTNEVPVNFKASENGTYTISVDVDHVEMAYLHLIDNMTGADVDLLAPNGGDARPCVSTYTFTAKTTDYESRFKLVFAVGSSTGSDTFAFCNNGNWIINNAGEATLQVIDVNGRILSSETVNGSVSKAIHAASGVYVIRLINGDDVKVQKIVVR